MPNNRISSPITLLSDVFFVPFGQLRGRYTQLRHEKNVIDPKTQQFLALRHAEIGMLYISAIEFAFAVAYLCYRERCRSDEWQFSMIASLGSFVLAILSDISLFRYEFLLFAGKLREIRHFLQGPALPDSPL